MYTTSDIVEFIAIIVGIMAFMLTIPIFMQTDYFIKGKINHSVGTVYCNNEEVYSGKLYRVKYKLITQSFQSPMFSYRIKSPRWAFVTEKSGLCDLFYVKSEKE